MHNSLTKTLKSLIHWLGLGVALLIIGMVILIFLGRQSIDNLDQLRPSIQSFIASSIGMKVNLGELQGEWPQLIPIIDIAGIEIIDANQDSILSLQQGRADLDLFSSIKLGTPIWRELVIDDLAVNFIEDATGHWRLKGFSSQSDADLDIIIQPFLFSRLIRLKSVSINLHFFSGKTTQVFGNEMLIENDADFHRAQLSLSLAVDDNPAQVIFEAYGDPSDIESFSGQGYIKFEQLNLSEPLLALTKSLMPELFENFSQSTIKTGGEIWVDIHPGGGLDYEGHLSVSTIPLNWLADVPPISDVKTVLIGWYTPGQDWGAQLQDLQFDWATMSVEPLDMLVTQHLGSNWQEFDISVSHLNLTLLSQLLREAQISATKILEVMDVMRPSGNLSSLSLGKNQVGYYLSANLDSCHILPYRGIPGVKNIHGYLELQGDGGLFHIADSDGFEIYFPKIYRDFLTIDKAQGTVYFDWSDRKLSVHSDPIFTEVEAGDSQIKFSIERPRYAKQKVPEFNLLIGARDLDLSYIATYLPYKMPESSANWLQNAIKSGNSKEFGLLFRGGPPKRDRLSRTTQVLFDIEQTEIKFNPLWPQLSAVDGLVMVDDGAVSSQISSALLGRAAVVQATAEYSVSEPVEHRRWIIDGRLEADLSDMMEVLVDSPVREKLGSMPDWHYSGETQTQVHLELPAMAGGRQTASSGNYQVVSAIDKAELSIAGSPVELEAISGSIGFSSQSGLYSDDLVATLWQQPLSAKIFKLNNQQKVSFNTDLKPINLNQFVDFSWHKLISGVIPIEAMLTIDLQYSGSPATLNLASSMQGAGLKMPAPLGKPPEEPRELDVTLYFDPQFNRLEGKLGDLLLTDLHFQQGRLQKGLLSYDRSMELPADGVLSVAAYLPTTDLQIWQPLAELISENKQQSRSWNTVFDFQFDRLSLATVEMQAIDAQLRALETGINVVFTSSLADGQVTLPWDKHLPPEVDLTRLQLPALVLEKSVNTDPRQLMALDFSVDKFSVAEKHIGALSFELRPEPSGAAFNNISGNLFGLRPGIFETEAPTDFFWSFDGQHHLSKIVGPVGVDNIGDLFGGFDMPRVLDSQSGKLYADLLWRGKPWALSKENLQGNFKVSLRSGSFYRTPGGAGATLKLISLFNFANWLRRLQLDFSDVVGQNLAYDSLEGTLSFDQGVFSLDEPLKMRMPSGRMSMAGDFNLIDETVDAQLVATLPVATNLPWLVGLAGGLPAAVGVYITSKLMEKQVDRLSSISYNLSGPWDQIEVSVDKIFAAELSETATESDQ